MERSTSEASSNQVISGGVVPLNRRTDLDVKSNSEEVTSHIANEIHLMSESSPAHPSTEPSSFQDISDCSNPVEALNNDTDLGAISNFQEATSYVVNQEIHMLPESLAVHQSTEPASHQFVSDGNRSVNPLNNGTDLGIMNNFQEVSFECAYCGTFSKWRREIESHIMEKHSDQMTTMVSDHDMNHNTSLQNVISEVANSNNASSETFDLSYKRNKCLTCGKVFSRKDGLTRHIRESCPAEVRLDGQEQPYSTPCPSCSKVFSRKAKWTSHLLCCGNNQKCPYCDEEFPAIYELLEHVVRSHEDEDPSDLVPEAIARNASAGSKSGKFRCCYCPKEIDTVKSFVQHWISSHTRIIKEKGRSERKCWICEKKLFSKKGLRRHIQGHTGEKTFPCDHCGKYFATKAEQRIHLKNLSLEKLFKCEQCGKGFKNHYALSNHLIRHGSEKPFQCPHCPKSFKFHPKLKEHLRVHTGEKPYECRYCDEGFARPRQRAQHELIKHDVGVQEYKCSLCSKSFKRRNSLNLHYRKHTGKVLRCDKCPFVATHKYNMIVHSVKHTGEKPFKCDQCSMQFTQKARWTIHMRSHTGERPYSCDQCDKAFVDSYSLKRHQRTHTGEKPYKCSYCSKSFAQGCQRQFHERTHTGEKPYECMQCDKKFTRRQELNKHLTTHKKVKLSGRETKRKKK